MKNNKGISMIELVIVIIIMIMIASFAIYNGTNSTEKAEATQIYTEITNVMKAVNGVMLQKELESGDGEWLKDYYDKEIGNGWYEIYGMNDSGYEASNVRKKLSLDEIKRNYMVNYETGEVMLSKTTEILNSSVRTYDSIRALVQSNKM